MQAGRWGSRSRQARLLGRSTVSASAQARTSCSLDDSIASTDEQGAARHARILHKSEAKRRDCTVATSRYVMCMQQRSHRFVFIAVAPLALSLVACAHDDVPGPLDRIGSAANDACDEALVEGQTNVADDAQMIERAWAGYRTDAAQKGAKDDTLTGLDESGRRQLREPRRQGRRIPSRSRTLRTA